MNGNLEPIQVALTKIIRTPEATSFFFEQLKLSTLPGVASGWLSGVDPIQTGYL